MSRWTPLPIVGGAYSDETRPFSAQDVVNWIPEVAEKAGTRSPAMLRDAPGYWLLTGGLPVAPVRGLHDVEGQLLAVVGTSLYRVDTSGQPARVGTIPGVGLVSMEHNEREGSYEVVIANGASGYVYDTSAQTLTQITDEGFPGMAVVDYVDGYMAGIEPGRRFWFHSELQSATEYNTLDRYDAEAAPDRLVALIVTHREVLVLGTRTGQFFRNTGAATGTFQNANGTEMEVGAASPFAVRRMDNTVYWLGSDGIVYRLEGNQPRRVSVGPIEQALAKCDLRFALAFTFEDRGHKIFYLTLPDGHTWGYDVLTNEWHRRESHGLQRWRLNALVKSNGRWIGGDYANGRLYVLDWNESTEDGIPMDKRRSSAVLHDDQNALILAGLDFVFETGKGAPARMFGPVSISGHLPGGAVGATGTYAYRTAGGQPARKVTLTSGALPPGATLDEFGVVTYDYTTPGDYAWTLLVTDARGITAPLSDSVTIAGGGFDPNLTASRYLLVTHSDPTDYSDPDFNDSAWATGLLPLGTSDRADAAANGFPEVIATPWPLDKNAWFRGTFELSEPIAMHLSVYLDDGARVWINGTLVFDHTTNDSGGTIYLWEADVDADMLLAGENKIAIYCRSEIFGINNYVSYRLAPA